MKYPTWADRTPRGSLRIKPCLACGATLLWKRHNRVYYTHLIDGTLHDASYCMARQLGIIAT